MDELAAKWMAERRAEVQHETWGHLGPEVGRKYHGELLVAVNWNSTFIIETDFPGLENSPWEYAAMTDIADDALINSSEGVYRLSAYVEWDGCGGCKHGVTSQQTVLRGLIDCGV